MSRAVNTVRTETQLMSAADFSWPLRILVHIAAVGLIKPIFFVLDKLGYSARLWDAIGRKIRRDVIEGADSGDYRPRSSDVMVCTFPKEGTNWTMQIAHQFATRGAGEFDYIHDVIPWPDFSSQEFIAPLTDDSIRGASPTGLRIIKTHL
jgi:hypothetical protein